MRALLVSNFLFFNQLSWYSTWWDFKIFLSSYIVTSLWIWLHIYSLFMQCHWQFFGSHSFLTGPSMIPPSVCLDMDLSYSKRKGKTMWREKGNLNRILFEIMIECKLKHNEEKKIWNLKSWVWTPKLKMRGFPLKISF